MTSSSRLALFADVVLVLTLAAFWMHVVPSIYSRPLKDVMLVLALASTRVWVHVATSICTLFSPDVMLILALVPGSAHVALSICTLSLLAGALYGYEIEYPAVVGNYSQFCCTTWYNCWVAMRRLCVIFAPMKRYIIDGEIYSTRGATYRVWPRPSHYGGGKKRGAFDAEEVVPYIVNAHGLQRLDDGVFDFEFQTTMDKVDEVLLRHPLLLAANIPYNVIVPKLTRHESMSTARVHGVNLCSNMNVSVKV
ncbi:hypothetical protein R3P38DRAFT_2775918 [Favolaschia claudopus]|uniref:Uncharacterized protein n=1 Tax=Favolaschia claudopus TaxID=2862362 RepID=A0AAW0BLY7_9AGAR